MVSKYYFTHNWLNNIYKFREFEFKKVEFNVIFYNSSWIF